MHLENKALVVEPHSGGRASVRGTESPRWAPHDDDRALCHGMTSDAPRNCGCAESKGRLSRRKCCVEADPATFGFASCKNSGIYLRAGPLFAPTSWSGSAATAGGDGRR